MMTTSFLIPCSMFYNNSYLHLNVCRTNKIFLAIMLHNYRIAKRVISRSLRVNTPFWHTWRRIKRERESNPSQKKICRIISCLTPQPNSKSDSQSLQAMDINGALRAFIRAITCTHNVLRSIILHRCWKLAKKKRGGGGWWWRGSKISSEENKCQM